MNTLEPHIYRFSFKKTIALLTACAFLCTTLLSPFAQAGKQTRNQNFWEERKKTLQNKTYGPQVKIKNNNLSLLGQTQGPPVQLPENLFHHTADLPNQVIPASIGVITETYWAPKPFDPDSSLEQPLADTPFIIHIQDAHGLYSAQKSLGKIIKSIAGRDSVGNKGFISPSPHLPLSPSLLVGVEGAWGQVNTHWLKVFPDKTLRNKLCDYLLKTNKLTGEEHLAITDDQTNINIVGVDDPALHKANSECRDNTFVSRIRVLHYLDKLSQRLHTQKQKHYSSELKALDQLSQDYPKNEISLNQYIQGLKSLWSGNSFQTKYPHTSLYIETNALEQQINPEAVKKELQDFLLLVSDTFGKAFLAPLTQQAMDIKAGRLNPRLFYQNILQLAEKTESKITPATSHIQTYVTYLEKTENLRVERLNDELNKLEKETGQLLLKAHTGKNTYSPVWLIPPPERLYQINAWISLQKRLWSLEMTPDAWKTFQNEKHMETWKTVESFLARLESGAPRSFYPDLETLKPLLQKHEPLVNRFYELAERRNKAMVENLIKSKEQRAKSKENHSSNQKYSKPSILIAGGFHTPGLTRLFRRNGYSYIVVRPQFDLSPQTKNTSATLRQLSRLTDLSTLTEFSALLNGLLTLQSPETASSLLAQWGLELNKQELAATKSIQCHETPLTIENTQTGKTIEFIIGSIERKKQDPMPFIMTNKGTQQSILPTLITDKGRIKHFLSQGIINQADIISKYISDFQTNPPESTITPMASPAPESLLVLPELEKFWNWIFITQLGYPQMPKWGKLLLEIVAAPAVEICTILLPITFLIRHNNTTKKHWIARASGLMFMYGLCYQAVPSDIFLAFLQLIIICQGTYLLGQTFIKNFKNTGWQLAFYPAIALLLLLFYASPASTMTLDFLPGASLLGIGPWADDLLGSHALGHTIYNTLNALQREKTKFSAELSLSKEEPIGEILFPLVPRFEGYTDLYKDNISIEDILESMPSDPNTSMRAATAELAHIQAIDDRASADYFEATFSKQRNIRREYKKSLAKQLIGRVWQGYAEIAYEEFIEILRIYRSKVLQTKSIINQINEKYKNKDPKNMSELLDMLESSLSEQAEELEKIIKILKNAAWSRFLEDTDSKKIQAFKKYLKDDLRTLNRHKTSIGTYIKTLRKTKTKKLSERIKPREDITRDCQSWDENSWGNIRAYNYPKTAGDKYSAFYISVFKNLKKILAYKKIHALFQIRQTGSQRSVARRDLHRDTHSVVQKSASELKTATLHDFVNLTAFTFHRKNKELIQYKQYKELLTKTERTIKSTTARPVSISYSSDIEKNMLLEAIPQHFLGTDSLKNKQLIYVDLKKIYATFKANKDQIITIKNLIDHARRLKNVVLVLDFDVYKSENIDDLTSILNDWNGIPREERPHIISIASEQTQQTQLLSNQKFTEIFETIISTSEHNIQSDLDLLEQTAKIYEKIHHVKIIEKDLSAFLKKLQDREPFTPITMALNLLEQTISHVKIKDPENPIISEKELNKALASLPPSDILPLYLRAVALKQTMVESEWQKIEQSLKTIQERPINDPERDKLMSFVLKALRVVESKNKGKSNFLAAYDPEQEGTPREQREENADRFMTKLNESMDRSHGGMHTAKSAIKTVVFSQLDQEVNGMEKSGDTIGIFSEAGMGKTTLAMSIGKVIEWKNQVISVAGMQKKEEFIGFPLTYVGAEMSVFAKAFIDAGTNQMVIVIDEIDKASPEVQQTIANMIKDKKLIDQYFTADIPIDTSNVFFILTANVYDNLVPDIQKNIVWIELPPYTAKDKVNIGLKILSKLLGHFNPTGQIVVKNPTQVIRAIVKNYITTPGVRELMILLEKLILNAIRQWYEQGSNNLKPIEINPQNIEKFLGKPKKQRPQLPQKQVAGQVITPLIDGNIQLLSCHTSPMTSASNPPTVKLKGNTQHEYIVQDIQSILNVFLENNFSALEKTFTQTTPQKKSLYNQQVIFPYTLKEDDHDKTLPLLMGAMSSIFSLPLQKDTAVIGQMSVHGHINKSKDLQKRLFSCIDADVKTMIMPHENKEDLVDDVFGLNRSLRGAILSIPDKSLYLPYLAPDDNSRPNERQQIEYWNNYLDTLQETHKNQSDLNISMSKKPEITAIRSSGTAQYDGAHTETTKVLHISLSESSADFKKIQKIFSDLPQLSDRMFYILVDNAADAFSHSIEHHEEKQKRKTLEETKRTDSVILSDFSQEEKDKDADQDRTPAHPDSVPPTYTNPLEWQDITITKTINGHEQKINHQTLIRGKNPVQLFANFLTESTLTSDKEQKQKEIQSLESLLQRLMIDNPELAGNIFYSICMTPAYSNAMEALLTEFSHLTLGQLLSDARIAIIDQRAKKYKRQHQALVEKKPAFEIDTTVTFKSEAHRIMAEIDNFLAEASQVIFIKDLLRIESDTIIDPPDFQAIQQKRKSLNIDMQNEYENALEEINEMVDDFIYVVNEHYTFFNNPTFGDSHVIQEEVSSVINDDIDSLTNTIFQILDDQPSLRKKIDLIYSQYSCRMRLLKHEREGRLVNYSIGSSKHSPILADLAQSHSATTSEAIKTLGNSTFHNLALITPFEEIKTYMPELIAQHLMNNGTNYRVLTIDIKQIPVNINQATNTILSMITDAKEAGNMLLVLDLDALKIRFKKEGDYQLAFERIINQINVSPQGPPLVAMTSEETHYQNSENIFEYYQKFIPHTVAVDDPAAILTTETRNLSQTKQVIIPQKAVRHLINEINSDTIDIPIALKAMRIASDELPASQDEVTKDMLLKTLAEMKKEALEAKGTLKKLHQKIKDLPDQIGKTDYSPHKKGEHLFISYINSRDGSTEKAKLKFRIDTLLKFPWNKKSPDFLPDLPDKDDPNRLNRLHRTGKRILTEFSERSDKNISGLEEVIDKLELLLVKNMQLRANKTQGYRTNLLIKTDLNEDVRLAVEQYSGVTNRPIVEIDMLSIKDLAVLIGFLPTYRGSVPGCIFEQIKSCGFNDPILILHNIDKAPHEIRQMLIHLLDPERDSFDDLYAGPFDIRGLTIFCTAQDIRERTLTAPLLDRTDIIEPAPIKRKHLIESGARALKELDNEYNFESGEGYITIQLPKKNDTYEEFIENIIDNYKISKPIELSKTLSHIIRGSISHAIDRKIRTINITEGLLKLLLGAPDKPKKIDKPYKQRSTSILFVSPKGGVVGTIDAQRSKLSSDNITIIGRAENDIIESAHNAYKVVRDNLKDVFKLDPTQHMDEWNICLPISPLAPKKEGPSAGLPLAVAIASAIVPHKIVRQYVAATGELSPEGQVKKVLGIDKKIHAAKKSGIRTILLSHENKPDILNLPAYIGKAILQDSEGNFCYTFQKRKPEKGFELSQRETENWAAFVHFVSREADEQPGVYKYISSHEDSEGDVVIKANNLEDLQNFFNRPNIAAKIASPMAFIFIKHVNEAYKYILADDTENEDNGQSSSPSEPPSPHVIKASSSEEGSLPIDMNKHGDALIETTLALFTFITAFVCTRLFILWSPFHKSALIPLIKTLIPASQISWPYIAIAAIVILLPFAILAANKLISSPVFKTYLTRLKQMIIPPQKKSAPVFDHPFNMLLEKIAVSPEKAIILSAPQKQNVFAVLKLALTTNQNALKKPLRILSPEFNLDNPHDRTLLAQIRSMLQTAMNADTKDLDPMAQDIQEAQKALMSFLDRLLAEPMNILNTVLASTTSTEQTALTIDYKSLSQLNDGLKGMIKESIKRGQPVAVVSKSWFVSKRRMAKVLMQKHGFDQNTVEKFILVSRKDLNKGNVLVSGKISTSLLAQYMAAQNNLPTLKLRLVVDTLHAQNYMGASVMQILMLTQDVVLEGPEAAQMAEKLGLSLEEDGTLTIPAKEFNAQTLLNTFDTHLVIQIQA